MGGARAQVGKTADALARADNVLAANRNLIAAVDAWEDARAELAAAYDGAGWFGRFAQRRRDRADLQLRVRVQTAIVQRKRAAGVVRLRSADLPAHDWLKDAWR